MQVTKADGKSLHLVIYEENCFFYWAYVLLNASVCQKLEANIVFIHFKTI